MSTVVKDLGAVSAYAYAVEKGYTGTEAEFAELMADYAEVGQRAEDAADRAEAALDEFTSVTADATTLPEGSSATAEYSNGHLTLGIPKGDKGDTGAKGDGAVYAVIGNTSSVIPVGTDGYLTSAYTITIPVTFYSGKDNVTGSVTSSDLYISRSSGGSGEMDTVRGSTYRNVQTATIIYAIPAGWRVGSGRITLTVTIGTVTLTYYHTYTIAQTGSQGEQGIQGPIGATPNLTIGTVTTLQPTAPATATISGTADNPVLSFGIPKGDTGEVSQDQFDEALALKADAIGNYPELAVGTAEQIDSDTVVAEDVAPYQFRQSISGASNRAYDQIVGGSLVVNQLVNPDFSSPKVVNGVTYTKNVDGSVSVSGESTDRSNIPVNTEEYINIVQSHKYLIAGNPSGASQSTYYMALVGYTNASYAFAQYAYTDTIINNTHSTANHARFEICGASASGVSVNVVFYPQLFDLTAMFGTTIADYVYGLETATAGAGVEWLNAHFPKIFDSGYIPYNAGTLEHVSGLSAHKMVGFNQWDEEWESGYINPQTGAEIVDSSKIRMKNYVRVLPNTAYYKKTPINFWNVYFDANKTCIGYGNSIEGIFTTPENCYYIRSGFETAYGTTYKNDICINISSSRDGEYEPYEEHSYPLDSDVVLRGIPKLDANNNLYYDGDEHVSDGTVTRRYGIVDLGTLSWAYFDLEGHKRFGAPFSSKPSSRNLICTKYQDVGYSAVFNNTAEGISIHTDGSQVAVYDTAYTDAATFKTAMSGVYLVYEFAEPTTEQAQPFTNPQVVDASGTEEYVTDSVVPVGHVTKYVENLKAKLESAPASPTEDGDYIVRQTDGVNEYVPLDSAPAITAKADVTDLLKAFPMDSAQGAIASFSDGAELPLKSLMVDIEPVQDGTGDPSPDNVRPISGHTQAAVTRTGVNVWDEEWELNGYSITSGQPVATNGIRSKNYNHCVPNTNYYVLGAYYIFWYDADKNYLGYDNEGLRTSPPKARFFRLRKDDVKTYNHDISINYPSTDTAYHPYTGQSITIPLGQTVYGGTLDVLSGELVIDRAMRTLTGADDWILDSDVTSRDGVTCLRAYQEMSALKKPVGNEGNRTYIGVIIASNLPTVKNGYVNQLDMDGIDIAITGYAGDKGNYLYIIVNKSTMSIRTVADLKAWLAENNVQFCYELATPITVTLTPNELSTLLGANNIWSDAGEVTAEYRADPTLYIQRKIAEALS